MVSDSAKHTVSYRAVSTLIPILQPHAAYMPLTAIIDNEQCLAWLTVPAKCNEESLSCRQLEH